MHKSYRLSLLALCLFASACAAKHHEALGPDLCEYLPLSQYSLYCGYLPIDASTAASICNDSNVVTSTLASDCGASSTLTGTWSIVTPTGLHLTASVNCPGNPNHRDPSVWSCAANKATMAYVDGTTRQFSNTGEYDDVWLQSCGPAIFESRMSDVDGGFAVLELQVPALAPSSFAIHDVTVPSLDPNAVALSFGATPRGRGQGYYTAGVFNGGTVNFTGASQDPNGTLAFTLNADMAPPTGDVQEEFAIYCSDPNSVHAGTWLNFQPN